MAALVAFKALVLAAAATLLPAATAASPGDTPFNRTVFPHDFIFGAASSAYQYEGAYNEDGKGPSIWDIYTHSEAGKKKIAGEKKNGDVALNSYHLYKEDVTLAKNMGLDSYRFSISWSRVLPKGSLEGGVNVAGIQYYHNLINEVLAKGMQPFVTLFHWDSPQALEDEYQGFLKETIVKDYSDYAEFCFKEFGDRVKFWITFNEPHMFASGGYGSGRYAPGRCTPPGCAAGDSDTEPYLVGHNLLLSHAAAVKIYRDKYQRYQKGMIGITLTSFWYVPLTDSKSDSDAVQRALDFKFGWFMDPVSHGDYPFIMRALLGNRLPNFTDEQSNLLKGSFDFVGINYYTANYATSSKKSAEADSSHDSWTETSGVRNGVPIGPVPGSTWLYIYAEGFRELLLYVKHKYNSPVIYITENGVNELTNDDLSTDQARWDPTRIYYHDLHLKSLQRAMKEGVDVRGYFAWTLLDDFEWNSGYTLRFGLHYVDFKNETLPRYPKESAKWFKNFLKKSPHHN